MIGLSTSNRLTKPTTTFFVATDTRPPTLSVFFVKTFKVMMTKRLRLVLTLVAASIVYVPGSSHASEQETYWYGFYVGAASATCELNKAGKLSHEYTKDFLIGAFEKVSDIPASARSNALKEMRSTYKQCPLPK
jgi:hypothetical protein